MGLSSHVEILLELWCTFAYTKNNLVVLNSNVPVYQSHHKRIVIIHPQDKCSVHFSTKNKEYFLLPKIYESKKVHVGIETHHIYFSCWERTYQLIWISR